jgi:hypothetical protein
MNDRRSVTPKFNSFENPSLVTENHNEWMTKTYYEHIFSNMQHL